MVCPIHYFWTLLLRLALGDIVFVNIAGVTMVVLNSLEACQQLTGKNIYNGRPYKTMINEL